MTKLNLTNLENRPTNQDEDWKYTNLKRLWAHEFTARKKPTIKSSFPLIRQDKKNLAPTIATENFFPSTVANHADEAWLISVDEKTVSPSIITIEHDATDNDFLPTILDIEVADGQQVTVVESFVGQGTYLRSMIQNIRLGKGARLKHYRLQQESKTAFHIINQSLSLTEKSEYEAVTLSLGGLLSRHELDAKIDGVGAVCNLGGVMVQQDKQHADTTLRLHHTKPDTASQQNYKTVLDGQASAVFQGRVTVDRLAQRTDAAQLCKGLLLSEGAVMNAKPELKIYADDVKCAHGATMGQVDEAALFYLRSRGIQEKQAQALLIEGFIGEVLSKIENEDLRLAWLEKVRVWLGL